MTRAVEIDHLAKTYGRVRAVEDFSLTVDRGEIVALVGPDGAGKTTIFRAVCGLIDVDSGRITVAGLDVAREFDKVKAHLGYMPQVFSLYPDLSVEENLRFYAGLFGVGRAEFARKREVLYDFSGLGLFSGRRAGALSGGMKQKLSLSCALVHDPEVLVLDEPTTGVDPVSRQQFWNILKDLKARGSAIAVATPYMDEVATSDRAVLVFQGRTLGAGTPAELVRGFKGRVYRLDADANTDRFSERAHEIARIQGLSHRRLGPSLYFYLGPGTSIRDYSERLAAAGVRAEAAEEIAPSLEDVFVQLMGEGAA
ncbi:MAG: ABC transporter ATP-binding protein [bacterium]